MQFFHRMHYPHHTTQHFKLDENSYSEVVNLQLFCNCLRSSGRTGIIASEEEDVPVAVEETFSGHYIVVFDPIDGSANIDTALTTGSIFGIYGPDKQCLLDIDDDSTVILSYRLHSYSSLSNCSPLQQHS